jgi:hypothetical protein
LLFESEQANIHGRGTFNEESFHLFHPAITPWPYTCIDPSISISLVSTIEKTTFHPEMNIDTTPNMHEQTQMKSELTPTLLDMEHMRGETLLIMIKDPALDSCKQQKKGWPQTVHVLLSRARKKKKNPTKIADLLQ